jgi:hypothetical protein
MTATITTLTATEIDELVGGFFTDYAQYRTVVTDARTADGRDALVVVATHRWADPYDTTDATRTTRYDVCSIGLTGGATGAVEYLMGDYRTQAEAEAVADKYLDLQVRSASRRAV